MSRLDHHVALVQNKLAVQRFLYGLAWTCLWLSAAVLLFVLIDRLLGYALPRKKIWFLSGGGLALITAIAYAIYHRPSRHEAAVAIDERLALKEKFSTALYVRPLSDPFAAAAVRDAEKTADSLSLHKRFPLQYPRIANYTVLVMAVAFASTYLHPVDLFGHQAALKKQAPEPEQVAQTKKNVQDAIAKVEAIAKAFPNDTSIAVARKDLEKLVTQPITDTARTNRSAAEALSNLDKQIKQQIQQNQGFAQAENDQKMLANLQPPVDDKGPVADAHRDLAKGDYQAAATDLKQAVDKFNQMTPDEQKKAAQQMAQLAQQLQKMANNPQAQQQMQQKLQQMGANQQQAKAMQQMMQQAAAGNPQAQQQIQQAVQQMQQQMNNGQGATAQQKQAMQQMMKQMQAQANGQMQAQQMGQAAQQMGQAMQQAAQGQQQQPGNGQQNPQAGNNQQQMANAAQQMQNQLQQMDAIANDAAQQQAAAQNADQAAQNAADQANGGNPGQAGDGKKPGGPGQGQWAKGNPNGPPGQGFGGPGRAAGGRPDPEEAPFDVKQEAAPVQNIEKGKILASTFVKAGSIRGDSKAQLEQVVKSADHEATDDVDSESVSGEAKQAVKGYFGQLAGEAQK